MKLMKNIYADIEGVEERNEAHSNQEHTTEKNKKSFLTVDAKEIILNVQGDSSFTAGGKIDLKNYDFTFIFCKPNLLSIRHIISKNEIYKLIR
jgi:hypothetical protein